MVTNEEEIEEIQQEPKLQESVIERDPSALFFESEFQEVPIEIDGKYFQFTVKGLSQYEVELISSEAMGEIMVDPVTHQPSARINQGIFYQKILLQGVVRAPFPWNEENVTRLKSTVRDKLISAITGLSDGMEAIKKKYSKS